MKKFILVLSIAALFLAMPCLSNVPGPAGGDSFDAAETTPVKGPRTLAGSLLILMSLGAGYSVKKIYLIRSLGKEDI